jgi:outer membrane protein
MANVGTTIGVSARTFNFFNFNMAASQLIYDFGQTDGRWRSSEANRDAALSNEHTVEVQTLLNVRHAYFQARAQKELAEVAAATVKNQERHLTQIEAFVRAGIRPDIDLAQARTDLANAKVQLVTGTNNVAVSLALLDQAMGVTTEAEPRYELADNGLPPVDGEDGPLVPLVDRALGARPDLATIQRQRRAQELLIRSLKGGYGPALSAVGGASEVGTQIDHMTPNWFGGLTLSWPLLQGGFTRGQIHEAMGTLSALDAQEDVLRQQVRVDVEQARLGVRAAKATITAASEALINGREQLRLAEARYEHGLGSVIELGDAQIAFSNAAAQDVQARYGLSAARAQLLAAVGVR